MQHLQNTSRRLPLAKQFLEYVLFIKKIFLLQRKNTGRTGEEIDEGEFIFQPVLVKPLHSRML